MSSSDPDKDKWSVWVGLAWILAAIAVVGAIVMISETSRVPVSTGALDGRVEYQTNYVLIGAAIGQALGAIFLAVIVSMLNSIYQNSCDVLLNNQKHEKTGAAVSAGPESQGVKNSQEAGSKKEGSSDGKGIKVGYINKASPLFGLVQVGDVILRINASDVTGMRQAGQCLVEGENHIAFLDHKRHLLERTFELEEKRSIGIKPA